ncbi:MAG: hypothetical protein ACLUUO_19865 [Sellimonas intestinalis]
MINIINGLMNTVQQPASEVAVTRILPEKYYQKVGGMRYLASATNSILTPILATVLGIAGMSAVIIFDLLTFAAAFVTLAWKIRIPETSGREWKRESLLTSAGQGIVYLRTERGIFGLILFLAAINLVIFFMMQPFRL